jgi:hypothetical protein
VGAAETEPGEVKPGEIDARLRQFDFLWSEIARRSTAQQTLIGLSVTVTGTVGGLVISENTGANLLIVLAVVVPVLGFLWVDHARNIGEIATFVRCNWVWSPNWEQHSEHEKRRTQARYWFFMLAMALTFVGPPLAGLIAAFIDAESFGDWAAWGAGLTLTALLVGTFVDQIRQTSPSGSVACSCGVCAGEAGDS